MKNAIVLAAGKGTRMKSAHCKVMHKLLGEPMIGHIYDHLKEAGTNRIVMVVGYGREEIIEYLGDKCEYAVQQPQLGSGDAVRKADVLANEPGDTMIVNGDAVLIQPETYQKMYEAGQNADLTVLTAVVNEPGGYGRIIRDEDGKFVAIREAKDCSPAEKEIHEVNAGIYCVDNALLWKYLPQIYNDNIQKEYYFTDLVEIFLKHGLQVNTVTLDDAGEMIGVNDRVMLDQARQWLQNKINTHWMKEGVTLIDPARIYLSKDTVIGQDTVIYPDTVTEGKVVIGKECRITTGTYLRDCVIGDHVTVDASEITDSQIGNETTVGPWAHLRNGCKIGEKCRIGNFVELKNTSFGYNTKCAHLTYVGDSEVGSHVNFGCGVVTVNYDGKHKFHTKIDDGAFIGSNVNIIAPVHVGENALLAAGSTITDDVKAGDMGIARSRQSVKEGYGKKYLNK